MVTAANARRGSRPRKRVQRERDVSRGLKPLGRRLLEAVLDDPVQGGREVRAGARELGRVVLDDRRHRLGRRLALEGAASGQHLVEHAPEREEIGPRIRGKAAHLLGCHVTDRAHHGARIGRDNGLGPRRGGGCVDLAGKTEIENLDLPIREQEEILRLQVPMNQVFVMRRRKPARHLHGDVDRLAKRQRAGGEPLAERLAFE